MARTRWPTDLGTPASSQARQIRPAAPVGAMKPGTRPTDRFAGQPERRQPNRRSGRDPGPRPYAHARSKPGKQGRKHYPHPPCRIRMPTETIDICGLMLTEHPALHPLTSASVCLRVRHRRLRSADAGLAGHAPDRPAIYPTSQDWLAAGPVGGAALSAEGSLEDLAGRAFGQLGHEPYLTRALVGGQVLAAVGHNLFGIEVGAVAADDHGYNFLA